jgi:hypothetical protein
LILDNCMSDNPRDEKNRVYTRDFLMVIKVVI